MNKTEARTKLKLLIDEFEDNKRHIKEHYTEEDTKQTLIQPFFETLGWDFRRNEEVRYERSGGKGGRVDYVFGKNQFYLEAKAASINLDDNAASNYILQANLYAYNKSKFCLLTDFEDFKLIKPIRPNKNKPIIAIVDEFNFKYDKYLENFNLLYDTFSKEAVLNNNSLEKLLEKEKKNRKFLTIDEDFLGDLDNWRKDLALDIYKNNKKLIGDNSELLTEYTQRLLDRIIFVKILEDRGIEHNLLEKFISGENIYPKILKVFKEIGGAYNGLIFNPHPVDEINISDTAFQKILENIYDTPKNYNVYRFNEIPIEILGSIYERFLGKIIQVNPENTKGIVKVIDKPEVRKAGGVYYTPDYIVEYIVKNTVGKLFEKKTPREVKDIKIIDIACGSGSFLVEAYTYLLNWYLDYYINNPTKAKSDNSLYKNKLTREKRKEILKRHIYGVDIDPQAVEVTQMSLFVKMLEDCPDIQHEFKISEFILPDMKDNIKCGNSLIEGDITGITDEERSKIRPFNWEDKFPEIIQYETTLEGERKLKADYGFDCVIGNPPYRKGSDTSLDKLTKDWLAMRNLIKNSGLYRTVEGRWDLFIPFIERAMFLIKDSGYHGYIVEHSIELTPYAKKIRKLLYENNLYELHFFPKLKLFKNAQVVTTVYLCQKREGGSNKLRRFLHREKSFDTFNLITTSSKMTFDQVFNFNFKNLSIDNSIPLGVVFCVCAGAQLQSHEGKYRKEFMKDDLISNKKNGYYTEKYIEGDEIKDYYAQKPRYVSYYHHIRKIKRPRFKELFDSPKLILGCSSGGIVDNNDLIVNHSVLILKKWNELKGVYNRSLSKYDKYFNTFNISRQNAEKLSESYSYYSILAILLSQYGKTILMSISKSSRTVTEDTLKEFPLINIDSKNKDIYNHLEESSIKLLELNKKIYETSHTEYQRNELQDQINKTDKEINNLVYKLYGSDSETKEGRETIEMIERELEK